MSQNSNKGREPKQDIVRQFLDVESRKAEAYSKELDLRKEQIKGNQGVSFKRFGA